MPTVPSGPRGFLLAEPATALTDLGLGVLAATFAFKTARIGIDRAGTDPRNLRGWVALLFGATAAAAFAGALVHGPLASPERPAHRTAWMVALGSVSISGVALSAVGARMMLPRPAAWLVTGAASIRGARYVAKLRPDTPYASAIEQYAPGIGFAVVAFLSALRRPDDRRPALTGLLAVGFTLLGAAAQRMRVGIHPRHFDHNAVYHCIQAAGLVLMDRAATGFMRCRR